MTQATLKEKPVEMQETKRLEESPEQWQNSGGQVRIAYMGAFLSREDAEVYREEFFSQYGQDVDEGFLCLIQDDLVLINAHWVVRIMAENAQGELPLE